MYKTRRIEDFLYKVSYSDENGTTELPGKYFELIQTKNEDIVFLLCDYKEKDSLVWDVVCGGKIYNKVQGQFLFEGKDGKIIVSGRPESIMGRAGLFDVFDPIENGWYCNERNLNAFCGENPRDYGRSISKIFIPLLIDREGNVFNAEYQDVIQDIYENPSNFLKLKTEDFVDKSFVKAAIVAAKNGIKRDRDFIRKMSADFDNHVKELVAEIKDKTLTEFNKCEEQIFQLGSEKREEQNTERRETIDTFFRDL